MSGYWNRDTDEPFKCWHTDCFHESGPVRRPALWEKLARDGEDSPEVFIENMFGGAEYMAHLEITDEHYAADIAAWRVKALEPMTPDGYAWAPWAMGADCQVCGEPA